MGCAQTKKKLENQDDKATLNFDEEQRKFKVLLLGAGESGKSTVIKQLKVLHKIEMDQQEFENYRITIHNNTLTSMQVFIEAAEKFGLSFSEDEKIFAKKVVEYEVSEEKPLMTMEIGEAIEKLSKSEPIKKAFERRSEFWNLDAADYYFEHVLRFVGDDYKPNEDDCIMARVRTTGIVSTEFDDGPIHFSVLDVAGQRSERKKWAHCFENVNAIVFVVSLAGYNQVMFEDSTHNRMKEALNLFQTIVNNPLFTNIPIFLFLNKKDLFEKMIQDGVDLKNCFGEYMGGCDAKLALQFIRERFEKQVQGDEVAKKTCTCTLYRRSFQKGY